MRVLLRLAKRATWSGDPSDANKRAEALISFERRIEDTDGVSAYEIEAIPERSLVLAAIACDRAKDDNPIDLLEIPRETVERYGDIVPSAGETPVPAANRLHRSLNWEVDQLHALAGEVFDAGLAATRYGRKEIRAALATLDPDRDLLDDAAEARDLVRRVKARPPG